MSKGEYMDIRIADKIPKAIGTPEYVYDYVLKILKDLKVKTVLDAPTGNGAFTAKLLEHNFDVSACDILPDRFKLIEQVECKYADMNDRLPYDDDSFQAIVCLNGMHRIWARGRAIGESSRVLVNGGYLIITNANNVNLAHRLAMMGCGSANYNTIGPPYGFLPDANNPAAFYRRSLNIADVINVAGSAALELERIAAVKISLKCVCLAPLSLLSLALSLFLTKKYHEHCYVKESNSLAAMFGDYIAIVLRKINR